MILLIKFSIANFGFFQLMKVDTREKKIDHLLEIARSLQNAGIASCGSKYFANVKELFVIPLLKGNWIVASSVIC